MRPRHVLHAVLAVAMVCGCARRSTAQAVAKSQVGGVTQHVAGTRIDILYRRPVARGRSLFGTLVPWGRIWTPSADSAARVTISAPVTVNGAALPAGSYGIWAIPDCLLCRVRNEGHSDARNLLSQSHPIVTGGPRD